MAYRITCPMQYTGEADRQSEQWPAPATSPTSDRQPATRTGGQQYPVRSAISAVTWSLEC
jgi:hypothetical protein